MDELSWVQLCPWQRLQLGSHFGGEPSEQMNKILSKFILRKLL